MFRGLVLAAAIFGWSIASAVPVHAQAACQYILGFKALYDLDPGDIGECVDNQAFGSNGDAQQHTRKGLMAWRKADNWTAFTNGYMTWINGPNGLANRLNSQRFSWEADAAEYPLAESTAAPSSPSILYHADWSNGLNGWTNSYRTTPPWTAYAGILHSDGSGGTCCQGLQAPFSGSASNYAVEAEIQWLGRPAECLGQPCDNEFGLSVNFPSILGEDPRCGGWLAGVVFDPAPTSASDPDLVVSPISDTGWHLYRLEARDHAFAFSVDGRTLHSASLGPTCRTTPFTPGVWATTAPINVRAFRVLTR